MSKKTIFQDAFLVAGIMCFDGCGKTIQNQLQICIAECIEKKILPSDAQLSVDAEPHGLGIHRLIINIESDQEDFFKAESRSLVFLEKIKKDIKFEVIDSLEDDVNKKTNWANWINILINLMAIGVVVLCVFAFPPSLFLTSCLATLSFLVTAFTARAYLFSFFHNLREKKFMNMGTTISLGWFLSLGHTLFHSISMPMSTSFSMAMLSFSMPLMLMTCINGMDEIKRIIIEKSKKIQLKGMRALFPKMSEKYQYYPISQEETLKLSQQIKEIIENPEPNVHAGTSDRLKHQLSNFMHTLVTSVEAIPEQKNRLRADMLIEVKSGECFPVDSILMMGETMIDASILTGEPQQHKKIWEYVPGGAINLGPTVVIYAVKDPYNSTVNSLLFRSNRARESVVAKSAIPTFVYYYTGLIICGIAGAVIAPVAFGVMTLPLVIQNIIGILFSTCLCTIAIAHELPKLISIYHRYKKGIHLRDDRLVESHHNDIHTVIFDKTGTLTTGESIVASSDIPLSSPLWQRIYLLEKTRGGGHPLAKAIIKYYEAKFDACTIFTEISQDEIDEKHRGLAARVQGKMLQIGSYDYLKSKKVLLPELDEQTTSRGLSAVYVAEEGVYKGVIYVEHEVRQGVVEALTRLKQDGKKIIMLTGDNHSSAHGFNQRIQSLFDEENIVAGQTPQDKELFLEKLMSQPGLIPQGVWFCGDGLNDAPCCRAVSDKGGTSCAMSATDKSSFFTDITLNGSLDYLFKHHELNRSLKENINQNKGILIYSTLGFLAFIVSFAIAGLAVPPLIPMSIMSATTLFVILNAYRTQFVIDRAIDNRISWLKKILSSKFSIGLLVGGSALLMASILVATTLTTNFAMPTIVFSAGLAMTLSSLLTISALGVWGVLIMAVTIALLCDKKNADESQPVTIQRSISVPISCHSSGYLTEDSTYEKLFPEQADPTKSASLVLKSNTI